MTNVKFNSRPFEGTFHHLVDNLFSELPVLFKNDFNDAATKGFVPVNVKETEKAYRLEVIAPGFGKADFKVNVDDKLLTISAEASGSLGTKEEKEKQIRREYSYRSFKRTFTLDEKIDATKIEASYINGVLQLNLPKKEVVKASATEITIQ
ncbi:MAG TPA: Hsp20/alpha crystallin family protein [Chitinophagaceae bacterium]|nr:Hsp20/alpha crystallin family protein [Chitinophagaceae bacterium]